VKAVRHIIVSLLLILPIITTCLQPVAHAADVGGHRISSRGAIVIDFETGEELFGHNADVGSPPASMTKMMTVYLIYEAIDQGTIDFDTVVPISGKASSYSGDPGFTNVPLSRSGTYTVDELLDAAIVVSAAGATIALAELVGGSTQAFLGLMNEKVAQWGIDAVFYSVFGGSTGTSVTPRAMAAITRNTILEFPEVLDKTSKKTITFKGQTYPSTNELLGVYEGIDGYKTGSTSAYACFTGTAQRGDIRIITVIMGGTYAGRFKDTRVLLDHGFAVMEEKRIEESKIAPIASNMVLNGVRVQLAVYPIDEAEYYNICDLAYILKGTSAQFDVKVKDSDNTILLTVGKTYAITGDEMAGVSDERTIPVLSDSRVIVDEEEAGLTVFEINGGRYFLLDDVADICNFTAIWDDEKKATVIDIIEPEPLPSIGPAQLATAPVDIIPVDIIPVEQELPPVHEHIEDDQKGLSQAAIVLIGTGGFGILCIIFYRIYNRRVLRKT